MDPAGHAPGIIATVTDATAAEAMPHPVFVADASLESDDDVWLDVLHPDDVERARDIHDFKIATETPDVLDLAIIDNMPLLLWTIDDARQVEFANKRWSIYTGLGVEPGHPCAFDSVVHPDDRHRLATVASAHPGDHPFECELRLRRSDGVFRWHLLRGVPLGSAAWGPRGQIVTATDIESRKLTEAALATSAAEHIHRANHDPLTNLANRARVMARLTELIEAAERDGTNVVLLCLDIDRFKSVNDSLGHSAGDALLIETAARIKASLRGDDVAGRMGGDEFLLACAADGVVEAAAIAARLQAVVRAPMRLDGKDVAVSASIGISIYPIDAGAPAELMKKADVAMCSAKQGGGDGWSFFSPPTSPEAPALGLELELRTAIEREQFVTYYQPIVEIATGRAIGAEALVRWLHPDRGLLLPHEFIGFAEEHGMIAQIGQIVLNAACALLASMQLDASDAFTIAVNVSARQFARPSFVGEIASAIAAHGIEARRLDIEITESIVMADTSAVIATLDRLEALGVKLSLDDFGTGYSSLAYIKNFPIHTLKIDRSFVSEIAINSTDRAIAKTIVTLAHSLDMRVIAEGVESREQLERLRSFDADCVQGFLISKPLTGAEFVVFMDRERSLTI